MDGEFRVAYKSSQSLSELLRNYQSTSINAINRVSKDLQAFESTYKELSRVPNAAEDNRADLQKITLLYSKACMAFENPGHQISWLILGQLSRVGARNIKIT